MEGRTGRGDSSQGDGRRSGGGSGAANAGVRDERHLLHRLGDRGPPGATGVHGAARRRDSRSVKAIPSLSQIHALGLAAFPFLTGVFHRRVAIVSSGFLKDNLLQFTFSCVSSSAELRLRSFCGNWSRLVSNMRW